MEVSLGTFATSSIEEHCDELAAGIEEALRHYCLRLGSSGSVVPVPVFATAARESTEVEVSIDAALEDRLILEGDRQEVEMDALIAHAVFVYLADLDSGMPAPG
jgi:hypothetical protein